MKKFLYIFSSLILAVSLCGQQYAVFATPAGTLKTLPNGVSVSIPATPGGTTGQIQFNNGGTLGGFTSFGDVVFNVNTGLSTIQSGAVSNSKLSQMSALTFKANNTGTFNSPVDITSSQAKSLLAITNADVSGLGTLSTQNSNAISVTGGSINGASVTGLSAPVSGSDAVNKTYADNNSAGIVQRTGVAVASTVNLTLSGEQTIDGILTSSSRILVKNQTLTQNNGIYVTASGAWSRASDSNTAAQLKVGYYYFVSAGTTQISTGWTIQTAPTVLGTDPVIFGQFSASTSYTAGTGLSLAGNAFTVNPALTLIGGSANNMPIGQSTPNLVSSSGGALNGTLGATIANSALVTSLGATGLVTVQGATQGQITLNKTGSNGFSIGSDVAGEMFLYSNLSLVGRWTLAGLNSVTIGATTPAAASFTTLISTGGAINGTLGATTPAAATVTTLASTSNANIRTTKGNFNLVINVKDYGATGNGSTDDGPAVGVALAALSNHGTLFFPPGKYNLATGIGDANNLSYITVTGQGAELYNTNHSNTMVFNSNCDHIEICNLRFTGNASVRGTGIHIRMYASNSSIHDNYFQGCSDFAVHVSNSGSAYTNNVSVQNNIINASLGDGIHVGNATDVLVEGNNINATGDDGIGVVADNPSFPPTRVTVTGNRVYNGASAGVRVAEGVDVFVTNNDINTTAGSGIDVGRYTSTTAYNARINVSGNRLYNTVTTLGPLGAIWMKFCNESIVDANKIFDNSTGYGIALLDFNDMTITNNYIRGCASRGIGTDDTTTTNVASVWTSLMINNNSLQYVVANQSIYVVPASGIAINKTQICNNVGNQLPSPDWIYYTRCNTIKIANNTSRDGLNVNGGGSTGVTLINNN